MSLSLGLIYAYALARLAPYAWFACLSVQRLLRSPRSAMRFFALAYFLTPLLALVFGPEALSVGVPPSFETGVRMRLHQVSLALLYAPLAFHTWSRTRVLRQFGAFEVFFGLLCLWGLTVPILQGVARGNPSYYVVGDALRFGLALVFVRLFTDAGRQLSEPKELVTFARDCAWADLTSFFAFYAVHIAAGGIWGRIGARAR